MEAPLGFADYLWVEQKDMTIPQRKAQLKKLIDSVKDPAVLEKVAKLLEKPNTAPVRQSPIVKRALKAEQDIKAGRVIPWDQVNDEIGALIDRLYSKQKRTAKRAVRAKANG